jgi:hypothetical protein
VADKVVERTYIKCESCGKKSLLQTYHEDGVHCPAGKSGTPPMNLSYSGLGHASESITHRQANHIQLFGTPLQLDGHKAFTQYVYPEDGIERFVAEHMASGCERLQLEFA